MPSICDKYNNSLDILYPSKQKWIIGGQTFHQSELGWVEFFNIIGKVKFYYDLVRATGHVDDLLHELAIKMDYQALEVIFFALMDRKAYSYRHSTLGNKLLGLILNFAQKPLPPIVFNANLYAMILRTDKVEFLSRYLDYQTALQIQGLFIEQNDLKSLIESFNTEKTDDKPSLGFYEQYIELLKLGIQIPTTWSIRKIDMVYNVLMRKKRYQELDEETRIGIRDRIKSGEKDYKINQFKWLMDSHKQVTLFGIEETVDKEVEVLKPGDY